MGHTHTSHTHTLTHQSDRRPSFDDTSVDIPLTPLIHQAPAQNLNSIETDAAYVSQFANSKVYDAFVTLKQTINRLNLITYSKTIKWQVTTRH